MTGGRHQSSSRFFKHHQELVVDATPCTSMTAPLTVSIPTSVLRNPVLTCANFGTLPDSDSEELLQGCRKQCNVNRYLDRTAGVAAIVRPCGIVVNFMEMFTCESPTQMYVFLAFSFAHGRDISRLKFVVYDRACDLHPFLCNLEKKGAYLAGYILKHVKFVVDRVHVRKHTEPCCKPPSADNPSCRYHPDHLDFIDIASANTECAEQSFRCLKKYKLF